MATTAVPPLPLARLTIELANICNLHCSYCMRDEDALYHDRAEFFDAATLERILRRVAEVSPLRRVGFTGGEVTLHPRFDEIVGTVARLGFACSFVTNGWHFGRVFPILRAHHDAVRHVAFSVDGADAAAHDRWRGAGSFRRVIQAVTRCRVASIPFSFKVTLRRDTVPALEAIAILGARLGARTIHCSHLLPTSPEIEAEHNLSLAERQEAEREIGTLNRIVRIPIRLSTGYANVDPAPPCEPLAGRYANVDYRARLTLCCNISGFRGAGEDADVVADLTREDFVDGWRRLEGVVHAQNERRRAALAAAAQGGGPDLYTASPCLFCLESFDKVPWHHDGKGAVPLFVRVSR